MLLTLDWQSKSTCQVDLLLQAPSVTTRGKCFGTAGGQRKIIRGHGLVYEDRQDGLRRLKLVRGLSNMSGQYNCFLNVIIQSLWHLPAFRQALLSLPLSLPESNGTSSKDAAVVRALHNIFSAFAKTPSPDHQAAAHRYKSISSTGMPVHR